MREPIIQGKRDGGSEGKDPAGSDSHPARLPRVIDPVDEKLRPQRLAEIVGQRAVAERLAIALMAARKRGEPLPHILFDGPPGLGKTTFATVLHNELGVELNMTSGAALDKKMDVMPYLTNAAEGSILFIDEIHRLPKAVEEFIYPVMEDFRVDVVLGEGMSARTINLPLEEVHDHRRDHPQRHALRPAPRAVPHARAPRVLRCRRPGPHHHDQRGQAADDDRHPRPRANWPAGAAAPPGSPTPVCAGSAIMPLPAATATSSCRSPGMPSTCRRSIRKGSTSKTGATWRP